MKNERFHNFMLNGINDFLGTDFTANSRNETITLKKDGFDLCSVAEDFVRLSLEDERRWYIMETLCWSCSKGANECCFMESLEPVEGWKAKKVLCEGNETYHVIKCPDFEPMR